MPHRLLALMTGVLGVTACAGAPVRPNADVGTNATTAPAAARSAGEARALLAEADEHRRRARVVAVQIYALDEARRVVEGERRVALEKRRSALILAVDALEREAIGAYARLADDPSLRSAPERPGALHRLARALHERGHVADAEARYRDLVATHPSAPEVPDAHAALAELAFAAERLEDVVRHCDAVLEHPGARRRASALYLKAWSLRGLGGLERRRAAMEALREVLTIVPPDAPLALAHIRTAAEQELVELYARHGELDDADAFFGELAAETRARLLAAVRLRASDPRLDSGGTY